MTKFEKCVVVWLVFFGFALFMFLVASGVRDVVPPAVFLGLAFLAALILTIVFCARKGKAKSQENQ